MGPQSVSVNIFIFHFSSFSILFSLVFQTCVLFSSFSCSFISFTFLMFSSIFQGFLFVLNISFIFSKNIFIFLHFVICGLCHLSDDTFKASVSLRPTPSFTMVRGHLGGWDISTAVMYSPRCDSHASKHLVDPLTCTPLTINHKTQARKPKPPIVKYFGLLPLSTGCFSFHVFPIRSYTLLNWRVRFPVFCDVFPFCIFLNFYLSFFFF